MRTILLAALVGVLVSGPVGGQKYPPLFKNLETRQERMSLAKMIREGLAIDQMDRLVPTLSPSERKWLDKEMGNNTSPERWGKAAKSKEFALGQARGFITRIKSHLDAFETAPPEKEFSIWVTLAYSLLQYDDFDIGLCKKNIIKNCPLPYSTKDGFPALELMDKQYTQSIVLGVLGPKFGTGFSH